MSSTAKRLHRLTLLLRAVAWLWFYRLALGLLPFRRVASRVPSARQRPSTVNARQLARTINRAARFVPQATCLIRALAGARLFAASGLTTTLVIGVRRSAGPLEAHAWLELDGKVVLGEVQDLHSYRPLSSQAANV